MGQALKTLASAALALHGEDELNGLVPLLDKQIEEIIIAKKRDDGTKAKEIELIIQNSYEKYFQDTTKQKTSDFYRAVCETVEEINKKLGSAQFGVPSISTLETAYRNHNLGERRTVSREEFQEVMKEVILGSGFTGVKGLKDVLLFVFGVPLTALVIKQRVAPKAISNDIFIPAVTSATVFLLAQLNKI